MSRLLEWMDSVAPGSMWYAAFLTAVIVLLVVV